MREGERWQPESRLDDEAANTGCAEIAEHGGISWEEVKADLGLA